MNTVKDIVRDVSGTDTAYASTTYALESSDRIEILSAIDAASEKRIDLTGSSFTECLFENVAVGRIGVVSSPHEPDVDQRAS